MKPKQLAIYLLSFTFVLILSSFFYSSTKSIRQLLVTEKEVQDICTNADWDTYQIDSGLSLEFYSKTFKALTKPQEYLLYLIQTEDLTKLKDYVISYAPLVIFVCFAYITMIIWMIYIACAKYPRYCFKREKEFVQTNKGKLFFILLHACFIIVIICSIFAYIYSNYFSSYITSATCALTTSFNDFIYGQPRNTNTTIAPTWIGVNHLETAIYNTLRSIDQMRIVSGNVFKHSDWAALDPIRFDKELINLELNYSKSFLPTPNPQNERVMIRPHYLQNYASSTSGISYMRAIQVEYELKIKNGTDSLVELRKNFFSLKDNYKEIKLKFTNINIFMKSMKYYFDQINGSLLTEWVKYYKMADVGFHVFFLFLFAFQTFCAVSQIVLLHLLNLYKRHRKKLQIAINVIWNAYAFSIIFSFMSGFGFIVTSYASIDALHVLSFIFGKENLLADQPIIVSNSTIGSYLNTCLHSDGNLARDLLLTNTNADNLNVIYNAAYTLRNTKQELYRETKSRAIPSYAEYVNSYKKDIHQLTNASYGTDDVSYVFKEWSKYTSSHYHDYQSLCEMSTLDQWVGLKDHCTSDYTYITPLSPMDKGEKRCLVYDDGWTTTELTKRYRRACDLKAETFNSKVHFYSALNASEHYIQNLLILKDRNLKLIDDMVKTFLAFEKSFNEMSTKLLDNIIEVEPLINISYDSYHDLIGDNEVYSMMNCKYFQGYFGKLYDYLHNKVAPSAINMGILMIINSIFGFASLVFLFFSKAEYLPWEGNEETSILISSSRTQMQLNVGNTEKFPVTMIDQDYKPEKVPNKNDNINEGDYNEVEHKLIIESTPTPNSKIKEKGMISISMNPDKSENDNDDNY